MAKSLTHVSLIAASGICPGARSSRVSSGSAVARGKPCRRVGAGHGRVRNGAHVLDGEVKERLEGSAPLVGVLVRRQPCSAQRSLSTWPGSRAGARHGARTRLDFMEEVIGHIRKRPPAPYPAVDVHAAPRRTRVQHHAVSCCRAQGVGKLSRTFPGGHAQSGMKSGTAARCRTNWSPLSLVTRLGVDLRLRGCRSRPRHDAASSRRQALRHDPDPCHDLQFFARGQYAHARIGGPFCAARLSHLMATPIHRSALTAARPVLREAMLGNP